MSRGPLPKKNKINSLVELEFRRELAPAPGWLDAVAKDIFNDAVEMLREAGADIQEPDHWLIATYAQSLSDVERLTPLVRNKEANGRTLNPLCRELKTAHERLRACAKELGFSPAARKRNASLEPQAPPPDLFGGGKPA